MAKIRYRIIPRKDPVTKVVGYGASAQSYSNIGKEAVLDYAVQNSNIERSVIEQVAIGLEEAIVNFLCNGHNLQFWPLGSFRMTINSKGSQEEAEFDSSLIQKTNVRFTPSPTLKRDFSKRNVSFERIEFVEPGEGS